MYDPGRDAPGRPCGVLLLLALALVAACSVESSAKTRGSLRFSAIPDANTTELAAKYDVVARRTRGGDGANWQIKNIDTVERFDKQGR